jgi:tryptophan synthase beta subunit
MLTNYFAISTVTDYSEIGPQCAALMIEEKLKRQSEIIDDGVINFIQNIS